MNRQQFLSSILLVSLLALGVVPYLQASAQTCDPEALKPVSYGQRGPAVRNAQACLMEAGYDIPAGATGYYGAQTRAAVKEFYRDWYGPWHGNSLGPRGVTQLQSMLAGEGQEGDNQGQTSQADQPSSQVSQEVLAAVLTLLLQGKTTEALALLAAMGVSVPTSTATTTEEQPQQQPAQQQQPAREGFLVVDRDPTVTNVTVREGESARVFGLRFRADNGPVSVKSIFLRWTGSNAPWRVISKLELVDSQGNVLFSRDVNNNTFLQDSNLNYYLPVTGLNVDVPVNQYVSLFVKVNVVNTLPSGVSNAGFEVRANDVRARDGVGIDRFGPVSPLTGNFTLQQSLANSASFVVAKNVNNSPKEGYVFGDVTTGNAYGVKLLSFDVTAKNDSLRLKDVTLQVSNTSSVSALYLKQGNNTLDVRSPDNNGNVIFDVVPVNFVINKDQTVTFDVVADLIGGTSAAEATTSATVTSVTGLNSLGGNVNASVSIVGPTLHYRTLGPELSNFAVNRLEYVQDQNTSTLNKYVVEVSFNVTPRGGTIYMGTATSDVPTATSTFVDLKLDPTSTSSPTSIVVSVYQGNTEVTNSLSTQSISGVTYFVLSENQTYTFKITAEKQGGGISGLQRWIVDNLYWSDGSTTNTMDWTEQNMYTDYRSVNLQ